MFLLDSQVRNGDDKMHISQSGRVGGGGDLRETKTKDRKIYFICVCTQKYVLSTVWSTVLGEKLSYNSYKMHTSI